MVFQLVSSAVRNRKAKTNTSLLLPVAKPSAGNYSYCKANYLFKFLTPQIAVAGQLRPEDMRLALEYGFKTVINNRPDYEEENQPLNEEIEQAATALGLKYFFQPVVAGKMTDDDVRIFEALQKDCTLPLLLFCRTGTRCTHLWALSQAAYLSHEFILRQAEAAGYQLTFLLPWMKQRHSVVQKAVTTEV